LACSSAVLRSWKLRRWGLGGFHSLESSCLGDQVSLEFSDKTFGPVQLDLVTVDVTARDAMPPGMESPTIGEFVFLDGIGVPRNSTELQPCFETRDTGQLAGLIDNDAEQFMPNVEISV